jgi:ABC-type polysaccharide/polyol phosphate export permease
MRSINVTQQLIKSDYDSASQRSPMIEEFLMLVRYKDLLRLLVTGTIKTRYKRSALGVVWTLLNPLLHMTVMTIAFSTLFKGKLVHYPVYILAGLLCWNFFSQTTSQAMLTLVWGGNLIKRIYLPRTIFAMSSICTGLVNLGLALIPLIILMLLQGHPLYPTWWFLPFAVLLLAMFSLGVALFMSTLAVFFTDVLDMYQVAVQAGFFLTAVMYPKTILPPHYQWYLNLNPMYNLMELFRTPIYTGLIPGPHTILAAVISAVLSLLIGWWVFTRKADEFAYRI